MSVLKRQFCFFFNWIKLVKLMLLLLFRQMESTAKGLAMAISVPVSTTVRPTVGEVMAANEWCPELIMGVANTTKVAQNPCVVALLAKVQTPVIQVTRNNATVVSC